MTASKALAVTDIAVSPDELTEAIRVAVPARGLQQDLRAIGIVWRRELIRFRSDRVRAITSLIQPVLFLFVLGTGLSGLASRGMPTGVDFKTFIYPGVVAMSVLFTAIFSAASIVWDREFGFLREMLVAPVSRSALVIGKALGGATVASFQGIVMLAHAGSGRHVGGLVCPGGIVAQDRGGDGSRHARYRHRRVPANRVARPGRRGPDGGGYTAVRGSGGQGACGPGEVRRQGHAGV